MTNETPEAEPPEPLKGPPPDASQTTASHPAPASEGKPDPLEPPPAPPTPAKKTPDKPKRKKVDSSVWKNWKDPWRGEDLREALPWQRAGLRFALRGMLISLLSAFCCGYPLVLLFLVFAAAAIFFGAFEIYYLLFKRLQIRLLELLFIVAVLGNVIGLTFSLMQKSGAHWIAIAVVLVLELFWILGACSWGLWVATAQKEQRPVRRLERMVLGLLFPFSILGLSFSIAMGIASLVWMGHVPISAVYLVASVLVFFLSLRICTTCRTWHASAKATENRQLLERFDREQAAAAEAARNAPD